ncbi:MULTISPECIES: hypothetical protein [unclassified Curtobacterium]|jgi:hypothetical protein|uniref:hypothetical protein n=1 Tax=unclassified Curtobacterium TaxID=257496 RepID=UPI0011133DC8|nr:MULTISPECIES: hypothetical protein [unclassified Curtobacterium]
MPTEHEVAEAKRSTQKVLFERIEKAAGNSSLQFPQLESLARAYRYVAGGSQPGGSESSTK